MDIPPFTPKSVYRVAVEGPDACGTTLIQYLLANARINGTLCQSLCGNVRYEFYEWSPIFTYYDAIHWAKLYDFDVVIVFILGLSLKHEVELFIAAQKEKRNVNTVRIFIIPDIDCKTWIKQLDALNVYVCTHDKNLAKLAQRIWEIIDLYKNEDPSNKVGGKPRLINTKQYPVVCYRPQ
jgi:hypothetical protein